MAMEVRILGPLEVVEGDGPVRLGGLKPRAVLAHLAIRANHVVPAEVLIEQLWGEELPEDARNALQTHVSRLRSALGDGRIESRPPGYVLRLGTGELDAGRFEALVGEARADLAEDPAASLRLLDDAIALWRGPALSDLAEEPSLAGEIARLEELRLSAVEDRVTARLALGQHALVVGELEALTRANPLRERLWGDLMLALYRSGRQADALDAYARARAILGDELGIDPSRRLQRLHAQVLAQDRALSFASRPARVGRPVGASGDLAPDTQIAGYRIEDLLGRGGMSTVYLAEDLRLHRRVALKILSPELSRHPGFRERFVRESQIAAGIEHPGIVPIYEAGEAEGVLYIAMRYVRGTDLRRLIAERGPLEPERAVQIAGSVAEALDAAHEEGLVHRDVKPGNILIVEGAGSRGRDLVYLSDFGLTKRLEGESGALTKTGQFVGTVDYVAPEQIEDRPLDGRADLYSLGCVLFESLTGTSPFHRETEVATLFAHLSGDVPSLPEHRPGLPDGLGAAIATAVSRDPARRQATCGAFAAAATEGLSPATDGDAPSRRRRLVGAGAAALAVVALALAALVLLRPSAPAVPDALGDAAASPSPTPTTTFTTLDRPPTADEERLLALVPGSIRSACAPADPRAPAIARDVAIGAVACEAGEIEVLYELFETRDAMDVAFGNRVNAAGTFGGNCATDHEAQNVYTVGGRDRGRILCHQEGDRSVIAWTDENLLVLGHAVRGDLGDLWLYDWWITAGPFPGGTPEDKDGGVAIPDPPEGSYAIVVSEDDNGRVPEDFPSIVGTLTFGVRLSAGEYDIALNGSRIESGTYLLSKGPQIVFEPENACALGVTATYDWQAGDDQITWDFRPGQSNLLPNAPQCVPGPWPFVFRPWSSATFGEIALDGGGDLFTVDGYDTVPLGETQGETALDTQPAWSPDGVRIVFVSDRTGSGPSALYVMDADGSNVAPLTDGTGSASDPAWSPDGSRIAFTEDHEEGGSDPVGSPDCEACDTVSTLSTIAPDGTSLVEFVSRVNEDVSDPAWSPDGTTIAFTVDSSIHLVNADGSDLRRVPNADGIAPAWTPDGERLVFWHDATSRLLSIRPDGSGRKPFVLTPPSSEPVRVGWSSDGRWIVQGGLVESALLLPVTVTSADGSVTYTVASAGAEPSWRPVTSGA
jgi:serine/threonine-protein kinase